VASGDGNGTDVSIQFGSKLEVLLTRPTVTTDSNGQEEDILGHATGFLSIACSIEEEDGLGDDVGGWS